jgi:2-furoyl-CoA dehydrogenase FAD binding subunit
MKPRPFDYVRPDSVAEALDVLARYGDDARVLAGGQTLMAMLNLRLVETAVLIDISRLKELETIRVSGAMLEVGAAVTQNRLLAWPELSSRAPLLAKMLPWVGHFQTRNRGTVCGSIAHADPSSEIPLALAMLDGEVVLQSKRGTRTLKASEFQLGMLTTARQPDELIVSARFSTGKGASAFREIARRHGDFAIVSVAAWSRGANRMRVGVGGADSRPFVRDIDASNVTQLRGVVEDLVWQLEPYEDMHASPRLRRDLVRNLAPGIIAEALV